MSSHPRGVSPTMRPQPLALTCVVSVLLLLLCAARTSTLQNSPAPIVPKLRVAVMDMSDSALKMQTPVQAQPSVMMTTIALPPPADFAHGLTEILTTALVKSGRFVVLERAALEHVTSEQDIARAGRVNGETAAASGRIIGAQYLITGDITEFQFQQQSVGGTLSALPGVKASSARLTAQVALDVRLIDAVTSEVRFSGRSQGKASDTSVGADLTKGEQEISVQLDMKTPLGRASRDAIDQAVMNIVAALARVPWAARVIDVRDGAVYLNAGADIGLVVGTALDVFDPQAPLIDPQTGITLATPDRRIGSLIVEAVEDVYAIATITDGPEPKRNQLVRIKGQPHVR